jgi:site-specific recombinase XerD
MESAVAAQYQPALVDFSVPNQHRILQYLTLLTVRHYTPATLAAVVRTLKAFRRQVTGARQRVLTADLTQTTAQDIVAFIAAAQASGLAPSTINTQLGLLTAFFEHLRDEGQMTQQPVRRRHRLLTPTVLPKPIPDADLTAFFRVIDAVRDRLIFLFMLRCGLRVSEVCALTWDAIDGGAGTVRINRGKGQVDRIVYLSPDVEQTLQLWRAHHTSGPYLFPSPKRHRAHLFRSDINWRMHHYLAAAGVTRHYSPHCLRHPFATHLLNAGVSLEVLKELMGHHSMQLTLRYAQRYDTTKKQQYEQAMAQITQRQALSGREEWNPAPFTNLGCICTRGTIHPIPSRTMAAICACFLRRAPKPPRRCPGGTSRPSSSSSARHNWPPPQSTGGSMRSSISSHIS